MGQIMWGRSISRAPPTTVLTGQALTHAETRRIEADTSISAHRHFANGN